MSKKIPFDVYEAAQNGPVVIDINYSDLDYASGDTSDTVDLLTIPTDAAISSVGWKLIEAFDDTDDNITALTITIGDDDDADGYTEAKEVAVDGTEISSDYNSGDYVDTEPFKHYDNATTKTLKATFAITPSTGAASTLDQGKIRVFVDILDLS